ncbi:MAG: hypothetical protein RIR18_1941 [Pseudomonadota bacterium]
MKPQPTHNNLLSILYQDQSLIAVHKPAGLLTHRTALAFGETRFALQMLRDQIGQHVYPAHRLDRGTSGVLLFALNPETARRLGEQFESHSVEKEYLAVVRGHPPIFGTINHPITRQRDDAEWVGERTSKEAQPALSNYQRLACYELPLSIDHYPTSRYALLALQPKTGRRHQLRRHLKHIAHPIIGDATHGKGKHNRAFADLFGTPRLLLCCTQLGITHPYSGEKLNLLAPPAADFQRVLNGLKPYEISQPL